MIRGDSERWLLITKGEHAGNPATDLVEESPLFESITEFMAKLLDDAARVINCVS